MPDFPPAKQPKLATFAHCQQRAERIGMKLAFGGQEFYVVGRDGEKRYTYRWALAKAYIERIEQDVRMEGDGR